MKTHSYVIAKLIRPVTTAHQAQNFNPFLTIDTQPLGPESRRLNFETCICLDSTTPNVPRLHLFHQFLYVLQNSFPEGCCFLFCRIFRHPLYNTGQEWESEHLTVSFPSSSLTLKTPNLYILGSYMIVIYIKVKLICSWEHEENRNRIDWGKHIDWFPIPKPDSIEITFTSISYSHKSYLLTKGKILKVYWDQPENIRDKILLLEIFLLVFFLHDRHP